MSDENVGGLPELPEPVRMSSDQAYLGFTADQMRQYARDAISANGQLVVDERISRAWKLVERWEQPTIDGDTLTKEERLRNMGFAAMLRAELEGDTP